MQILFHFRIIGLLAVFLPGALVCLAMVFSVLAQANEKNQPSDNIDAPLTIAVASNFKPTLMALLRDYRRSTGIKDKIISASSGQLFAQIQHGAPFDIFLSADKQRPLALEQLGLIEQHSRQSYAIGQLVLWVSPSYKHKLSPLQQSLDKLSLLKSLRAENLPQHTVFAMANIKAAPYGLAAKQLLDNLQIWTFWQPMLVQAGNVSQVYQYTKSGNAHLALLSLAQIKLTGMTESEYLLIPENLYAPIEQQGVILRSARQKAAARRFINYLHSAKAQSLIQQSGYNLP